MADIPAISFYWRQKQGDASDATAKADPYAVSDWTSDPDGVYAGTVGEDYQWVAVGPSNVAEVANDSTPSVTIADLAVDGGATGTISATYEGSRLGYSLSGAPWLSIDGSGTIAYTDVPNVGGAYPATVTVANGAGSASDTFTVTVNEVVIGGDFTVEPVAAFTGDTVRMVPAYTGTPSSVSLGAGAPAFVSIDMASKGLLIEDAEVFSGQVEIIADGASAMVPITITDRAAPAPRTPIATGPAIFGEASASWHGAQSQIAGAILRFLHYDATGATLPTANDAGVDWGRINTPGSHPSSRWQGFQFNQQYTASRGTGADRPYYLWLRDYQSDTRAKLFCYAANTSSTGGGIAQARTPNGSFPAIAGDRDSGFVGDGEPQTRWFDSLNSDAPTPPPVVEFEAQGVWMREAKRSGFGGAHSLIGRLDTNKYLATGETIIVGGKPEPLQKDPIDITDADWLALADSAESFRNDQYAFWEALNGPIVQFPAGLNSAGNPLAVLNEPIRGVDSLALQQRIIRAWVANELTGKPGDPTQRVKDILDYPARFWGGLVYDPDFTDANESTQYKRRNAFLQGHPGDLFRTAWTMMWMAVVYRIDISAITWPALHDMTADGTPGTAWNGMNTSIRDGLAAAVQVDGTTPIDTADLVNWLARTIWNLVTDVQGDNFRVAQAADVLAFAEPLAPAFPTVVRRGEISLYGAPNVTLPATFTVQARAEGDVDETRWITVADQTAWPVVISPIVPPFGRKDRYQVRAVVGGTPGVWSDPIDVEQEPNALVQIVEGFSHTLTDAVRDAEFPVGAPIAVSGSDLVIDLTAMTGSTGEIASAPAPGDMLVVLCSRRMATSVPTGTAGSNVAIQFSAWSGVTALSRLFPATGFDFYVNAVGGGSQLYAAFAGEITQAHLDLGALRLTPQSSPGNINAAVFILRGADLNAPIALEVIGEPGDAEYGTFVVFQSTSGVAPDAMQILSYGNPYGGTATYLTAQSNQEALTAVTPEFANDTRIQFGWGRVNGDVEPDRFESLNVDLPPAERPATTGARFFIPPAGTVAVPTPGLATGRIDVRDGRYYWPDFGTAGQATRFTLATRFTYERASDGLAGDVFRVGVGDSIVMRMQADRGIDLTVRAQDGAAARVGLLDGGGQFLDNVLVPVVGESYSVMLSYDQAAGIGGVDALTFCIRIEGDQGFSNTVTGTGPSAYIQSAGGGMNLSERDLGLSFHEWVWASDSVAVDPRDDAVFGAVFDGTQGWAARRILTSHGSVDFGGGAVLPAALMNAPDAATWNLRHDLDTGTAAVDA